MANGKGEDGRDESEAIEGAVIDKVQEIVERSKRELEKIQCPEHGQALKKLDFDRANGRFVIETCCATGETLVNSGIATLG